MSSYVWPSDDGWPYPDTAREVIDPNGDLDEDLIWLRMKPHLLDGLDPLERQVIAARFGFGGQPIRSMKELHADTGLARSELREALGSGLAKLRLSLA
jgi:DNA-directed RNA polymerase sigma subunit (sigma70/sigma32)